MKKIFFTLLIYNCIALPLISQKNTLNSNVGMFVGEGTGILFQLEVKNNFLLEFDVCIDNIFLKRDFEEKYQGIYEVDFDNIYSCTFLVNYKLQLKGIDNVSFLLGIGVKETLIPNFSYFNVCTGTICYPGSRTELRNFIAIKPVLGLEIDLSDRFKAFCDGGLNFELDTNPAWKIWSFRLGAKYLINAR